MGLPAYLLGLSIPIIGVITVAVLIMKAIETTQPPLQHEYTRPQNHRQRINNFNNCIRERIGASDQCTICQHKVESGSQKLECGHVFHSECVDQLLMRGMRQCPNCRTKIV